MPGNQNITFSISFIFDIFFPHIIKLEIYRTKQPRKSSRKFSAKLDRLSRSSKFSCRRIGKCLLVAVIGILHPHTHTLTHFSFLISRLVFDRESGKPKGYGFCEYKDQETALSAMRNLNGYEIGGRTLRVDNACTEKSRMEMQQLLQGPQVENPYGDHCDADQSPEIITKTVASLPPEQMYELMKQMKACIENNPNEAKQMLLLNPQLAYALLQSMVVMRIVDPQTAVVCIFCLACLLFDIFVRSLSNTPFNIRLILITNRQCCTNPIKCRRYLQTQRR